MLGAELFCDEDSPWRAQASGVSDQLPEVVVVSRLQKILDYDEMAGVRILENHVNCERADGELLPLEFKIHLQFLAEQIRVVRQPRREVSCFIPPDLAQQHILQVMQLQP